MTVYYVVDDSARRADRTSFPTADEAIELAAESARKLNRAISIWEIESERKPDPEDYPKGALAERHYAMVLPDGDVKRTKNGDNPYVSHMENEDAKEPGPNGATEREESLEELNGLPTRALGQVLAKIDEALAHMVDGTPVRPSITLPLHRIGDAIASIMEKRMSTSRLVSAKFHAGQKFVVEGTRIKIVSVDQKSGTIQHTFEGEVATTDAATLARYLLSNLARADSDKDDDKEKEAVAHHLAPGNVGVVDQKDTAYVLDAQEGLYVVLMNGSITQIPDDVTRIVKLEPTDEITKKKLRVWTTFFSTLLKQQGVNTVEGLDSDMKTRVFDLAKRKWPKVEKKFLTEDASPELEKKPAPKTQEEVSRPAGREPVAPKSKKEVPAEQPSASTAKTLLQYAMELCRHNIEAAARLEESVRFAFGRDTTKLHAIASMRKFDAYELPQDWFVRAKFLAGIQKFAGASLKNVDMTPPLEARACAARALGNVAEAGETLPAICLAVAKTLASGKTVDMNTLERMHQFHTHYNRDAVPAHVWDAWGGGIASAWVANLAKHLWSRG